VRTDGSTVNTLLKLDGGMDINSHMNLGTSNTFTSGLLDLRDNKPGSATDVFLGYEDTRFSFRYGPEKFAARNVARDTVLSLGAETYAYTVGSNSTTNRVDGSGLGNDYLEETCVWAYHDPAASQTVAGSTSTRTNLINFNSFWRYDQSGNDLGTNWTHIDVNDASKNAEILEKAVRKLRGGMMPHRVRGGRIRRRLIRSSPRSSARSMRPRLRIRIPGELRCTG